MQHTKLNLPPGDVLVHCGDFTNHGSLQEVQEFAQWISSLPYRYKVIVPGNHDLCLDTEYYNDFWSDWALAKDDPVKAHGALTSLPNTHLLIDKGIIDHTATLYSPLLVYLSLSCPQAWISKG
jgi:predicted phosphodiesterase